MYETFEQAAKQARDLRYKFGAFTAELAIPDDDPSITLEPGRPQSGHRTLHVAPLEQQAERLLALVVAVNPVERAVN